jgi:hypothetical protein
MHHFCPISPHIRCSTIESWEKWSMGGNWCIAGSPISPIHRSIKNRHMAPWSFRHLKISLNFLPPASPTIRNPNLREISERWPVHTCREILLLFFTPRRHPRYHKKFAVETQFFCPPHPIGERFHKLEFSILNQKMSLTVFSAPMSESRSNFFCPRPPSGAVSTRLEFLIGSISSLSNASPSRTGP